MGRAYLIIIILGGIIAAMLPSGRSPHSSNASTSAPLTGTFSSTSSHRGNIIQLSPRSSIAGPPSAAPGGWTTLEREANGHFFADAQVNGQTVHFLVDTGASGVALTTQDAQRVGLSFSPADFTVVGSSASGELRGKMVSLDRVSLGGHDVSNVSGVIMEGGEMSLLGQSFLSQMGTIEISGDRMTIK